MTKITKSTKRQPRDAAREQKWPGIDSHFRLIVVAALRNKQLLRGAHPRIDANPLRRKNASIALEEVKRGLVPFTITEAAPVIVIP
ncbi:MAG: polymerase Rpb6 [Acidobacteriota bacterium]|jgi:DNA-directed RNA polymerase omega subunit|nr:polymerase Rpb6 [Acidobacteriota bacterium]